MFTLKNQRFALSRSHLGIALAALVLGSGAAYAQKLDVESLARMPDTTGVSMSAEGDFIVASQRYRDQGRNAADVLEKLTALVAAVAVPAKKRRPTKPTRGSVRRRVETKQARSRTKKMRRAVDDEG